MRTWHGLSPVKLLAISGTGSIVRKGSLRVHGGSISIRDAGTWTSDAKKPGPDAVHACRRRIAEIVDAPASA